MNFDSIIIEFITNNYLTLTIMFTALKGVAKITPWAWDDSIVSLLFGAFKSINPTKSVEK